MVHISDIHELNMDIDIYNPTDKVICKGRFAPKRSLKMQVSIDLDWLILC